VSQRPFVDYYEVLQLSPRATGETIDRVYRLLAKRYHPDNLSTGDRDKFTALSEAHEVLSDSERRSAYDVKYDVEQGEQWKIFDQESANDNREQDRRVFHAILSLLYVERRRNPKRGGLGPAILERLLGVPEQHLEFPIWYIKQRGWIEVLDNGQVAITVTGIDKLIDRDLAELSIQTERLLPESTGARNARPDSYAGPRAVEHPSAVGL